MPDIIDIVVVDDHRVVRRALRRLLNDVDDFQVVGEAADGEEAIQLVRQQQPHIAILDVNMPKLGGIEASQRMQLLSSPPKVVILTMYTERGLVFQAFEAGCTAYVMKQAASAELVEAVRESVEGRFFLSEELQHLWSDIERRLGL